MAFLIDQCEGFEWDEGNAPKNWEKHQVAPGECEEIFFNLPLLTGTAPKHSIIEDRYYVLGRTEKGRRLFLAFTIRQNKIRVISARDMSCKERKLYDETVKRHPEI